MPEIRPPRRSRLSPPVVAALALLLLGPGLALWLWSYAPPEQTLPEAPAAVQTTPLREDFADPRRSRFKQVAGDGIAFAFADAAYRIEVQGAGTMAWSLGETRYGDGAVQVEATLAHGPGTTASGLIFRYRDDRNFYLFSVAGNGFYNLELRSDGAWQTLIDWTPTPAIRRPGNPNILRVETAGDRIVLYVNGVWLEETRDRTFAAGSAGMAVHTYAEGGAAVLFDNFVVAAGASSAGSVLR